MTEIAWRPKFLVHVTLNYYEFAEKNANFVLNKHNRTDIELFIISNNFHDLIMYLHTVTNKIAIRIFHWMVEYSYHVVDMTNHSPFR